ncbi:MAG: SFCGS family glycine-rich protein [Mycoplasmatales bacterium]
MSKPVIVIGHRMGQGKKVAAGIEKAGGVAIVIPGMAADMKVGDVMKEHEADLGISFCGSGGAGALTASNKYGYRSKHSLRSVLEGQTAVKDGIEVLGFGFMDTEELGMKIVEAYNAKHA